MSAYWKMFDRAAQLRPTSHVLTRIAGGRPPGEKRRARRRAPPRGGIFLRRGTPTRWRRSSPSPSTGGRRRCSTAGLLPARPPGLRPPQCALHRRRGDHGLLPHGPDGSRSEHWECLPDIVLLPQRVCPRVISRLGGYHGLQGDQSSPWNESRRGPLDHAYTYYPATRRLRRGSPRTSRSWTRRLWERAAAWAPAL